MQDPAPRSDRFAISESDRRRAPRHAVHLPVTVQLPPQPLNGTSADVSDVGVMFVTDEPLQVTVRIERGGRILERIGRVVRTQQLGAVSTAIAIEFEEEDPDDE